MNHADMTKVMGLSGDKNRAGVVSEPKKTTVAVRNIKKEHRRNLEGAFGQAKAPIVEALS